MNWDDIERAISEVRAEYSEATKELHCLLDDYFGLFFGFAAIAEQCTKDGEDETYLIELACTIARRAIASLVLLESGLFQEAVMVLRNALELVLILADIAHNQASMQDWKNTCTDDIMKSDDKTWPFSKASILKRLKADKARYPDYIHNAAGNIDDEWKRISNSTLHAHSYAQIQPLLVRKGQFALLQVKDTPGYREDFKHIGAFLFNAIAIVTSAPKYSEFLEANIGSNRAVNDFNKKYMRIGRQNGAIPPLTKAEVQKSLGERGLTHDVSGIPDSALIFDVEVRQDEKGRPVVMVSYDLKDRPPGEALS